MTDEKVLELGEAFGHRYLVTTKAADDGRKAVFRTDTLNNAKEFIDFNKLNTPRIFWQEGKSWRLVE